MRRDLEATLGSARSEARALTPGDHQHRDLSGGIGRFTGFQQFATPACTFLHRHHAARADLAHRRRLGVVRHLLPVDLGHPLQEGVARGSVQAGNSGDEVILSVTSEQVGDGEGV